MTLPIAFVDCETTHLDAEIGEAWEVAVILRRPDGSRFSDTEHVWQFAIDRTAADPEALRIGRFHERHLVDPTWGAAWTGPGPIIPLSRTDAVQAIVSVLRGAVLVGSNPSFDDRFLRKLLGPGSAQWHYRPYDIVQLAATRIGAQAAGPLPWRAHVLSRAVGVEPPTKEAAHTALGDARWARDVYDAVMAQEKFPLSWEGRARHAIGLYTKTVTELEDTRRDLARHSRIAKGLHIYRRALLARPGRSITTDFVRAALDRLIEHPEGICDLDQNEAAVQRANALASRWAVLRAHGGAATELRRALEGGEPSPLPTGFSTETCVTVKCAVCEYEFDEDESSTIHFEDLATAHATLRGYDWTILPDGRALCPTDDSEHQALRQPDDAPSPPVSPGQTTLDEPNPAAAKLPSFRDYVVKAMTAWCQDVSAATGETIDAAEVRGRAHELVDDLVRLVKGEACEPGAPCTCTVGEACDQCPDDDQDDEEFEETGDSDGDVLELISEIAGRLSDATDEGEYHAVGLISDLANGRKTVAEARTELAEITFRHV